MLDAKFGDYPSYENVYILLFDVAGVICSNIKNEKGSK